MPCDAVVTVRTEVGERGSQAGWAGQATRWAGVGLGLPPLVSFLFVLFFVEGDLERKQMWEFWDSKIHEVNSIAYGTEKPQVYKFYFCNLHCFYCLRIKAN